MIFEYFATRFEAMGLSLLVSLAWAALAAADCPQVKFFNVSYSATNNNNGVCRYSDIRFASPPVGKLRFAAPEYPPQVSKKSESPSNVACIQMDISKGCIGSNLLRAGECSYPIDMSQSEDCLFLDIYVPETAFTGSEKLPVVTWFHGGGYIFGSKAQAQYDVLPLYYGDGLVNAADNNLIFVASNYRLGAYGWLAGTYMEKNGQPNAGLLDQRAALQFIHDQIEQVHGDKDNVTAWGESAGASSLLHHLVMPPEVGPTYFHRALLQSPAYQWMWDRNGALDKTFNDFVSETKCDPSSGTDPMECLRSLDQDDKSLSDANQRLFQELACQGVFPLGPSVDGKIVPDIATNLLRKGQAVKLDSIMVSHVDKEIPYPSQNDNNSFIPLPIREHPQDPSYYDTFLDLAFGGAAYQGVKDAIKDRYPSTTPDQILRAQHTIQDSSFLCNTRAVIDAYLSQGTPVYAMDYAWGTNLNISVHASDLLPTFNHPGFKYRELFECLLKNKTVPPPGPIAWAEAGAAAMRYRTAVPFQSYLVSHAIAGDPNTLAKGLAKKVNWSQAATTVSAGVSYVTNVMQPRLPTDIAQLITFNPFDNPPVVDSQTGSDKCGFWQGITQQITDIYNKKTNVGAFSKAPQITEKEAAFSGPDEL